MISCKAKNKQAEENTQNGDIQQANVKDSTDSKFFPVTSFIKGQFLELDSLPVTILKIVTSGKKTDSSWLKKNEIRPLLQPFVSEEINETNLKTLFKESKFNDQTVEAITFTYDPISALPDSISLRHWVVYIHPEKGTIKNVYMVKQQKKDGKNYTQQLTWQTGKWAKIVEILNKADGSSEVVSDTKLVWNFDE